jgi:fucose permease
LWQLKNASGYEERYSYKTTEGWINMGIIASVVGIGILAYNHYYCSVSAGLFLLACGLVITGVLFYFFLERE